MTKNIVICLDGTANEIAGDYSNIARFYTLLDLDRDDQIAFYDPGVGTSPDPRVTLPLHRRLTTWLGKTIGAGLALNVQQAYVFLADHYEAGDRIYLIGFSRGAFTARVLAGLLHLCGLPRPGCAHLVPYIQQLHATGNFGAAARFRHHFSRYGLDGALQTPQDPPIHFLGLFDTVAAYGWLWNPTYRPFTVNNPSVRRVRHALSIDEKRSPFHPLRWSGTDDQKQVWFAGVHSDVGGGYPKERAHLSFISLDWMMQEAKDAGLHFDDVRVQRQAGLTKLDPNAEANLSLIGVQRLFQFVPKREWNEPAKRIRWKAPDGVRDIWPGSYVHASVWDRKDYDPPQLAALRECPVEPWSPHRQAP